MDTSTNTYTSDRRNLIFNFTLFCITTLALIVYSWVFINHIMNGLKSGLVDDLVWVATLCSTIFYGSAVYQSYITYVRRNGPQFSIGPFTILSTSLIPASILSATNNAPTSENNITYLNSPYLGTSPAISPKFEYAPVLAGQPQTPMITLSSPALYPSTPDSVLSEATPQLITPQVDQSYFNYIPPQHVRPNRSRSGSGTSTGSGSGGRGISASRIGRMLRSKSGQGEVDAEKGESEGEGENGVIGLGMGRIGREETEHVVRV